MLPSHLEDSITERALEAYYPGDQDPHNSLQPIAAP